MTIVFIFLIKIYRWFISPIFPATCRYIPSCSEYGIQAIQKYGAWKGGWMAVKRIASCHPWGGHGFDPVE